MPHPADPLQAVRPTRGDRVGAPHRLDLRRAKGPPASSWSTFAYSNSFSISSSPILACSRRSSSFRASGARLFRLAWPAARNRSCHCEARAAVIPTARDTDSRSSPRNRRSTTSRFRPTDNRPPRPGPGRARVRRRRPAPSLRVPRSRAGSYRWPVHEPRRTDGRCPAPTAPKRRADAGGTPFTRCRVVRGGEVMRCAARVVHRAFRGCFVEHRRDVSSGALCGGTATCSWRPSIPRR